MSLRMTIINNIVVTSPRGVVKLGRVTPPVLIEDSPHTRFGRKNNISISHKWKGYYTARTLLILLPCTRSRPWTRFFFFSLACVGAKIRCAAKFNSDFVFCKIYIPVCHYSRESLELPFFNVKIGNYKDLTYVKPTLGLSRVIFKLENIISIKLRFAKYTCFKNFCYFWKTYSLKSIKILEMHSSKRPSK